MRLLQCLHPALARGPAIVVATLLVTLVLHHAQGGERATKEVQPPLAVLGAKDVLRAALFAQRRLGAAHQAALHCLAREVARVVLRYAGARPRPKPPHAFRFVHSLRARFFRAAQSVRLGCASK